MGKDEACIDIKKLADSVRKMLKKVHPLPNSNLCCIYKVPLSMRRSHKSVYTPQIVSIGPFHHDNSNLQDMEEHKIRHLNHFLQRTNASIEDFLTLTKDKEADLRSCYAEFIELKKGKGKGNGKDFATIILVDALFLIELFLRDSEGELTNGIVDSIFRSGDLLLLENQLPLFILNDLFDLAKPAVSDKYNKKRLPCNLFKISHRLHENLLGIKEKTLKKHFPEAKHFLDLLRICFVPSNKPAPPRSCISLSKFVSPCFNGAKEQNDQHIPSAKKLHQAGVKFKEAKAESSESLLDITFNKNKRILEIPFLKVHGDTVRLYKNLLAFESRHGETRYFNDYVILISYLVKTPKAAELLVENGIVGLGSDEKLTHVFHSLVKDCEHSTHYVDLVKDLQGYCNCKYPWHKWNAYLKKRYFTTPWAFISFIAASILLVLTIMQTVCSFIAL